MDYCTRCFNYWKALILTYVSDTWLGLQGSLSVQRPFYICLTGLVGLGGGGGWHNMWHSAVACPVRRPPPTPSPPSQLPRQRLWSLISRLKKQGWGGGGGCFLGQTPHQLAALRKTEIFRVRPHCQSKSFPWETEFMNNALWSPRGVRAGERNRATGYTLPPARTPRGGQWALHLVQSSMDEKISEK